MTDWTLVFCLPHGLAPNGMTTWALNTASHLSRHGWPVKVFAHTPASGFQAFSKEDISTAYGIEIATLPTVNDEPSWQNIQIAYAATLPAIFFPSTVEQSYEHLAALSLYRPDDVRVVAWNHLNHDYEYEMIRHYLPLTNLLITNTDAGHAQLRTIANSTGANLIQLNHLPCPLDANAGNRAADFVLSSKRPLRLAYAGRFEDTAKRVWDLLAIADALAQRGAPIELTLLGSGPLLLALHEKATALNERYQENVVRLLDPLPPHQMASFWQSQDVLLLTSAYEGQSMQLMEAMRHGCVPIISTGAAAGVSLVRDGETALVFDTGDVDAAVEQVAQLIDRPFLVSEIGRQARECVDAAAKVSASVELLDASLKRLIGTTSPSRSVTRATDVVHRHWPLERPISMRAAATVSVENDDALRRFEAALAIAHQNGWARLAIYGAGRHTRALATCLADCQLNIRCIMDDDARLQGTRLWGWPVVSRIESIGYKIDAVILSSKMNEPYLLRHLPFFANHDIGVIALYDHANNASAITKGDDSVAMASPQSNLSKEALTQ